MKFKGVDVEDTFECGYCGKPMKHARTIYCSKKCEDDAEAEKNPEKHKHKQEQRRN